MKRSELKEAIKSEIKSVLLEASESEMKYNLDLIAPDGTSGGKLSKQDEELLQMFKNMDGNELKKYAKVAAQEQDEITQDTYFNFLRSLPNYKDEFTPANLREANESIKIGDIVTIGDGNRKYKVIDVEKGFMSDIDDVEVKSMDGMPIGSSNPKIGSKTATYKATQLKVVKKGNLKEIAPMGPGQTTTLADFEEEEEVKVNNSKKIKNPVEELFFHADSYKKNMIEIEDVKQAFEEILRDYKDEIIANRSVTFSDIREGTWSVGTKEQIGNFIKDMEKIKIHYNDIVGDDEVYNGLDSAVFRAEEMMEMVAENKSDIREKEMTDAEKRKAAEKDAKKEKKFAGKQKEAEDLKTKIEDKKAEMVKKAKEYKAAEGEKKEKIKDQLKKMTAERDELNKQLEKLKRVEI